MLKKHAHLFTALLWLFDLVVLALSFAAAYAIRFFVPALQITDTPSPITDSIELFAMALPLWSLCFYSMGLYGPRRSERRLNEVSVLAKATVLAVLMLVAAQYFVGSGRYSRGVILLFTISSFTMLATTRMIARRVLSALRMNGMNGWTAIVVGANELSEALIQRLDKHKEFGIRIVAVLSSDQESIGEKVAGHTITGSYGQLGEVLRETKADQIYLAMTGKEHIELALVHAELALEMVDVCVVPDVLALMTLRGGVEDMDGLPLVHLQSGPLIGVEAWLKRGFDLIVATVILLLAAPIMLFCGLVIKISSRGPVFYKQERMGLDGHVFKMLKFRSMPVNTESTTGAVWAKSGETRTFRFGGIMRKYSLDEIPQFINVLRGDMSLVGPRPERPFFIEQFKHRIPRYNLRHKMKAGITGLAQVEGWRGNTSLEKRIERDLHYIENWSLWLDVKILARTGLGGFLSRNAY